MSTRLIPPYQPFLDGNGDPLSGGKLNFYETGTTTPKNTYSDSSQTTANTNPIILNSEGQLDVDVWGQGEFKLVVTDSADGNIYTYDPLLGFDISGLTMYATTAALTAVAVSGLTNGDKVYVADKDYFYKWDSTSTRTDDADYVITPDEGGTGRWIKTAAGGYISADGVKHRIVAGVLRQSSAGAGWDLISGHGDIGLDPTTPVTESDGNVNLNYAFTASKVVSFTVVVDEGYAGTSLRCGASVGSTQAIIEFYHPFEARIAGTGVAVHSYFGTKGTDWDATATTADGTIVFTHAGQIHSDAQGYAPTVSMTYNGGNDGIGVSSVSKSGFTVETANRIAGSVSAAASPVVTTENAGTSSAAWASDTLTITHPTCAQNTDAQISAADPRYHASVSSSTTTTITVDFYDINTGAAYTGAAPPCVVRYMRGGMTPSTISGSLDAFISRGPVKVDATNVAGANNNIWFYGVFEV